jgi:AcrR family transcriptional regulator
VRRPQILATAVQLIREKGLWSVRLSDVARRAGISPTSVVYYFGTKDELFAHAIAEADDAFYEPLLTELDKLDRAVERMACLIVRSSTSDWLLWIDLWVYARWHPETATAQRRFHQRWRSTIADVIRYGQSTGAFKQVDADEAALRLAALTDGLAVHMVLGDPEHTRERYVAMSLAAVALELDCDLASLRAASEKCPRPRAEADRV